MVFLECGKDIQNLKLKMMKNNIFLLALSVLTVLSCSKKDSNTSYNKGELTLYTDESFKSVSEALADGYMINYPESKIKVETKKEDFGFLDLLQNKAKLIVMSRELSPEEIKTYKEQVELDYTPAKFAADAVVFVVPKNSEKTQINLDEISAGLQSDDKNFIFDGTNSSNLNFVAQKLKKQPKDLKFSVIPGSENLIKELNKFPNKIGVIGLNTFSRPYDKNSQELRDLVKILPVTSKGITYSADSEGLRTMKYPFTRVLYFLANESGFNIASGFIRYSCTQLGQLVVQKEGLQPYNLYKREVIMR